MLILMRSAASAIVVIGVLASGVSAASPAVADEQLIAFAGPSIPGDISVIGSDGTGRRRVTSNPADDDEPVWSPDGRRLAFVRWFKFGTDRGDPVTLQAIFVIRADGSGLQRLSPRGANDGNPAWSPDGTSIAFQRRANAVGVRENPDIWVMRADGTHARRLTRHPAFDGDPAWSPDGRKIAFVRAWRNRMEVFTMTRDGTGQQPLLRRRTRSLNPSWSPDGQLIAFLGWNDNTLYVVSPNGRDRRRLAGSADTLGPAPSWAPDGHAIAFTQKPGDDRYVSVVRRDGTGPVRLSEGHHPSWSTDSRMIAFDNFDDQDGCDCIYVIGADGSGLRRLTEGWSSAWQPPPG